jgi:hypothetical protein
VRTDRPLGGAGFVSVALALALTVLLALVPGASAASGYPTLPLADDRAFVGNLSAPTFAPGGSGSIDFTVGNPLPTPLSGANLTLGVYALNAFPGNATSNVSVASAPVLSTSTSSGLSVTVAVGALSPGAVYRGSVGVATSTASPSGAFAVRVALGFVANSTTYLLESRGWFTAAKWAAATQLQNGNSTLNLTVLGVSGVLPETAVTVSSSTFGWILWGLLGTSFVFVGVGAWFYFRRRQGSSSGIRSADDDTHAPTALGNSRTRDGD